MSQTSSSSSSCFLHNKLFLPLKPRKKLKYKLQTHSVHNTKHNVKPITKAKSAVELVAAADQGLNLFIKSFDLVEGF